MVPSKNIKKNEEERPTFIESDNRWIAEAKP